RAELEILPAKMHMRHQRIHVRVLSKSESRFDAIVRIARRDCKPRVHNRPRQDLGPGRLLGEYESHIRLVLRLGAIRSVVNLEDKIRAGWYLTRKPFADD